MCQTNTGVEPAPCLRVGFAILTSVRIFLKLLKWVLLLALSVVVLALCFFIVLNLITEPSNEREWNDDQRVLPSATITGDLITIKNIRNFSYASTTSYTPHYYNKTFDLSKIKRAWYVVEPFSGFPGSAHTFVSFEFEGNEFVAISIEIRKEKGESFSVWRGLFNRYELMYVIADERDVIKLRSNYRKDLVYLYPARTTPNKVRELFVSMVERANKLKESPEFYNTLTNTCTTNIVQHINTVSPRRVPLLNLSVLLPESSDQLAYQLGLIDTALPFEEARKKYFINERALKYADDPTFSTKIRTEEQG